MPAPAFHPREASPVWSDLLERIIERVQHDLPQAVGLAVAQSHSPGSGLTVLAASGLGRDLVDAQVRTGQGPVIAAVDYQVPVLSPMLPSDDRWPLLAGNLSTHPVLRHVRGAAAAPGVWQAECVVVLCAALDTPADARTVMTLIGYEQLIAAAMVTAAAQEGDDVSDVLAVLQSRGAIEQAKGVIMGSLRCDAGTAWSILLRASQESNVKIRVLAVALIEHVGATPAEQPATDAQIVADDAARSTARLLWEVISRTTRPN